MRYVVPGLYILHAISKQCLLTAIVLDLVGRQGKTTGESMGTILEQLKPAAVWSHESSKGAPLHLFFIYQNLFVRVLQR